MPRTDKKKQLIQGLTVLQVTSEFPIIDLGLAAEALKKDDPMNVQLQSCKVPPQSAEQLMLYWVSSI